MSYQTLSPSFLQPSISATNLTFSPAPLFYQGRSGCGSPEMEYTEGLKAGFWQEEASNGGGEDFFVDDLLDLSNQEDFAEGGEEEEEESNASLPESQGDSTSPASNGSSSPGAFVEPVDELAVPVEELADLEWLSHFVEDSFSSGTGALPFSAESGGEPRAPVTKLSFPLGTPVPMRARSKRLRTGRVWCCRDGFPESSSSSSSTSSSYFNSVQDVSLTKKRPGKRRNRVGKVPENAPVRRCSHCLVQKTPQWRAGPLGSKTLCNACGVRYKSGRLLPEYRPAGSPTSQQI
ncbi:GATA transcription factor 5 [Nymphaea thermarum]|nr:GATA transcription factor 5 [Nymphaea thermarum]